MKNGHQIDILIKKKDVLEELLNSSGMPYYNILPEGRKNTKTGIAKGQLIQDFKMMWFCLFNRPDLLVGTSVAISHVGKLLGIPSVNVNEDDAEAVPLYAKLTYPWANVILTPFVTSTSKWKYKTINYNGYHELAYLHPNHFVPDINVVKKYINIDKPYFIIRFSNLGAHHDIGIKGFNAKITKDLINALATYGNVIINSEKEIEPEFEKYRIKIKALDMHHLIAFASLFIGDSQTMAAEAGVLGTPFVRFNDFVDRIGYLNELEKKYELGYGIKPAFPDELINTVLRIAGNPESKDIFNRKRLNMLNEKIDTSKFLIWFIENYPESVNTMRKTPDFYNKFK
jgi:predicted glycosyltransferase